MDFLQAQFITTLLEEDRRMTEIVLLLARILNFDQRLSAIALWGMWGLNACLNGEARQSAWQLHFRQGMHPSTRSCAVFHAMQWQLGSGARRAACRTMSAVHE